MIINHNMMSMNAQRQMGANQTNSSKSMEKLSSGLRINRAGDDAAGLAISEKMRGQIRGLDQASRNAQDGISMIQTAEGALSETHSILQRMKELATQAANGTNTPTETDAIQKEMNQLTSEINRIGNTTEFNQQKVLNGGGLNPEIAATATKLDVPNQLNGGESGTIAKLVKTFTFDTTGNNGFAAADDGKTLTFNLGGKDITLTLNKNITGANSTATQVGISDATTDVKAADAIETALAKAIAGDADLSSKYELVDTAGTTPGIDLGDDTIKIRAKALSFSNGKLTGTDEGVKGSITFTQNQALSNTGAAITEAVTTAGASAYASTKIDFTGKSASDLIGAGIVIDGKKVDFYDGSKGAYSGDADFSVDLNGASNSEAIVDKIVTELYNGTTAAATKGGTTAAAGASFLANVYVSKDAENENKLLITAKTAGTAGNSIALESNVSVNVSNFVGSDKLSNESVVSARGLEDGQHTVTVTYKAASTSQPLSADGTGFETTDAVSVTSTTNLESGTYKLVGVNSGAGVVKLQKLGADGSTWSDVTGYTSIALTSATGGTYKDLTITTTNDLSGGAVATSAEMTFTLAKEHYEATLTEANGTTAGTPIGVVSGQQNVNLKAYDGVGEVNVNIGDIASSLSVGASTTFTFNTKGEVENSGAVGGEFTSKLQIGANNGQSFEMSIKDMRAQALNISGTSASGEQGIVDKAKFTATKSVTNGTDNTGAEYALDISSYDSASAAIEVIGNAINAVSAQRSQLGAYQNRLEHTINNLTASSENLTAAESRIRDVDMAKEMSEYTKNNILQQAAQAMLAQANQAPQQVLQLLR